MNPVFTTNSPVDFVLITALPEEREAVLKKLPGYQQLSPTHEDIRTYFQAELPTTFAEGSRGHYRVVVMCLLGMGRVQAAIATTDAIRRWHPRYLIMVGIAGGIANREVQVGDILISDKIVDYELQKITSSKSEIRWGVQPADPRLLNACNNFLGENWQKLIEVKRPQQGTPNQHTGPIASGDKVIAFSEILAGYQHMWPRLLGVEMEAAGVATAAFQAADRPGFFMIRGVSDLADQHKGSSAVEQWRAYACDTAAAFTMALLKSGPVPLLQELPQNNNGAYNFAEIRKLIAAAMSEDDLDIFCKEHFPEARAEFGNGMGLKKKIFLLVEYCERREALKTLVVKLHTLYPEKYRIHEKHLFNKS